MPTAYVMRMTRGALSPTNQVTPVDLRGHVTLVHKSGEFILLETSLAGTSRKWQLFPSVCGQPPPAFTEAWPTCHHSIRQLLAIAPVVVPAPVEAPAAAPRAGEVEVGIDRFVCSLRIQAVFSIKLTCLLARSVLLSICQLSLT